MDDLIQIREDHPTPGFYKIRLVAGGAFMPVNIWTENGVTLASRGFDRVSWERVWPWCAKHPIDPAQFAAMMEAKIEATQTTDYRPEAEPEKPIDLGRMKPIF